MTQGVLAGIDTPADWSWERLWSAAPRVQVVGQPDAEPLSVFLRAGVVPRSSREDNFNRLGEDLAKYQLVRPGDLVFNKLRTWQGGLGVSSHHGIVSPAYFVCRPTNEWYSRYLHYLLISAPYLAELTRISKFMPPSQFDIPWEMLRVLPLLQPPLDEQRRIADFLDAETARIDQLQKARTLQFATLEELVGSRISFVVPRKGEAPFVRLGYLAAIQSGVTVDSNRDSGTDAVTRPYLRVANVQDGHLNLKSVTEITVPRTAARASTLRRGDVLMTEGGDLDKLGRGTVWYDQIENCLHQNHVFAVRPDQRKLVPEYLAMVTRTSYARAYFESTGTKTTNLASTSSSKIRDFRVPMIDTADQLRIVREIDGWLRDIAKAQAVLNQQRALLAERRQALITAAVTGVMDVTTAGRPTAQAKPLPVG